MAVDRSLEEASPDLYFGLLGPLTVRRRTGEIRIGSERQRALLALLLLRAGGSVLRTEIVDVLWGDRPPPSSVNLIQTYIARLRRSLDDTHVPRQEASWLTRTGTAYAVRVEPDQVDLLRFRAAVAKAGRLLDPGEALDLLLIALGEWRAPCLHDLSHLLAEHPAVREIQHERIEAVTTAARIACSSGRAAEVIAHLRNAAAAEPLDETLHASLVLTLAAAGSQAAALAEYEAIRRRLDRELGLDPGPQLREAHRRVLQHEIPTAPIKAEARRNASESPAQQDLSLAHGGVSPPRIAVSPPTPARIPGPAMLPMDVADFTGRAGLLAELTGELDVSAARTVPLVVITGRSGVGKTAVAVRLGHQLTSRFPDGQLYADLRRPDGSPTPAEHVLARFLRWLGMDAASVPDSTGERAEAYRSLLAGRRMLVVLDDASDPGQVGLLLPGVPSCSVVLTTGSNAVRVPGARTVRLDSLPPADALDLLRAIVAPDRLDAEPLAARRLVRLCEGLPLAVRAAGNLLAAGPHRTLARLVERLTVPHRRLTELERGGADLRARFRRDERGLPPVARLAFRRLASEATWTAGTAATTLGMSPETAEDILDVLTEFHLIQVHAPDQDGQLSYRFPDLVRALAGEPVLAPKADAGAHAPDDRKGHADDKAAKTDDDASHNGCVATRGS